MMKVTDLPSGVLSNCMSFVGEGNFVFIAGVCRPFRDRYKLYLREYQKLSATSLEAIVMSVSRLQMTMKELNIDVIDDYVIDIQWRGKVVDFWTAAFMCAAYNGNLDILVWTKENKDIILTSGFLLCNEAAKGGQLQVLQWLHQNGSPSNDNTCRAAAANGHLDVLQWLHQNGCPWNEDTFSGAARNGHFEILKWLHENGCPWNKYTCSSAAGGGHIEILKWLRQNGCRWDSKTCEAALDNGHLEIFEWAITNGCPFNEYYEGYYY